MSRKSYAPAPWSMFVPSGRYVYLSRLANQPVAIHQIKEPSTQHKSILSAHSPSSSESQNHPQLTQIGLAAQVKHTLRHTRTFALLRHSSSAPMINPHIIPRKTNPPLRRARTLIDTDRTVLHPHRDRDTLCSKMSTMVSRHFCCTDSRAKTLDIFTSDQQPE